MGATARANSDLQTRASSSWLRSSYRFMPRAARPFFAVGVLTLGIGLAAGFHVSPPNVPVAISANAAGGWVVESVAAGSGPWTKGVRPGMEVFPWPASPAYEASGFDAVLDGIVFGVSTQQLTPHSAFLTVALMAALLSIALRAGRLPGAAASAGLASGVALMPLAPQLGLPVALMLVPLPLLATGSMLALPNQRLRVAADGVALGLAIALVMLSAGALIIEPPSWPALWALPMVTAVAIGIAGDAAAILWRYRHMPGDATGAHRLASAVAPMLVNSSLAGADRQRALMADDIHNRVLPVLNNAIRGMRDGEPTNVSVERMVGVGRELRSLMARDETVTLEFGGLGEAIRSQIAVVATDVPVAYRLTAGLVRPPRSVEVAAYRVAQAAIDNSIRHSGADQIEVDVQVDGKRVDLTVKDDGVGIDDFTVASAVKAGRVGLAQMRVRAETVGASLTVETYASSGTEVRFRWPK
jgi:signal transduction histidine kinase